MSAPKWTRAGRARARARGYVLDAVAWRRAAVPFARDAPFLEELDVLVLGHGDRRGPSVPSRARGEKTRNRAQFAWRVSRARSVEEWRRRARARVWVGADACAAERDDSRVETFRGGNDADARLGVMPNRLRVTLSPSARFPRRLSSFQTYIIRRLFARPRNLGAEPRFIGKTASALSDRRSRDARQIAAHRARSSPVPSIRTVRTR